MANLKLETGTSRVVRVHHDPQAATGEGTVYEDESGRFWFAKPFGFDSTEPATGDTRGRTDGYTIKEF